MKHLLTLLLAFSSQLAFANGLPIFSLQPTNQIVVPSNNATMVVAATGATAYQWRFDGLDIQSATNSILEITNAQSTNSGYYMALAQNNTGWVPSQLAYLAVVGSNGIVPLSNIDDTNYFDGQAPEDSTLAQVVAGPELDQMQLVQNGDLYEASVTNGYFDLADYVYIGTNPRPILINYVPVSTVSPGQTVYYSVSITIQNTGFGAYTQPSTVMRLVAGGDNYPVPSSYGLKFPDWPEWPEPTLYESPATNQLLVAGGTLSFTNGYGAYDDFGIPTVQWRKDGNNIPGATNFVYSGSYGQSVFTMTNLQASDAGVYDTIIYGNDWEVSPRIYISIQTSNGPGVFQNPSYNGTNFICTLLGAQGRNYQLQGSTNLVNWVNLETLANVTGTITFTNSSNLGDMQFYRTMLLP